LSNEEFDPAYFFDMLILEACPLRQGIVTVKTEIIFSYSKDKDEMFPPLQLEMPGKRTKPNGLDTVNYFVSKPFCIIVFFVIPIMFIGSKVISLCGRFKSFLHNTSCWTTSTSKDGNEPLADKFFTPMVFAFNFKESGIDG
jgi:hypothetical protein